MIDDWHRVSAEIQRAEISERVADGNEKPVRMSRELAEKVLRNPTYYLNAKLRQECSERAMSSVIQFSGDKFNLSGMSVGDWFLGCPKCMFQLTPKTAENPFCPNGCGRMNTYTVTEEDMEDRGDE